MQSKPGEVRFSFTIQMLRNTCPNRLRLRCVFDWEKTTLFCVHGSFGDHLLRPTELEAARENDSFTTRGPKILKLVVTHIRGMPTPRQSYDLSQRFLAEMSFKVSWDRVGVPLGRSLIFRLGNDTYWWMPFERYRAEMATSSACGMQIPLIPVYQKISSPVSANVLQWSERATAMTWKAEIDEGEVDLKRDMQYASNSFKKKPYSCSQLGSWCLTLGDLATHELPRQ